MRYYIGHKPGGPVAWVIFTSDKDPTPATHGDQFSGCTGPFRTRRAAEFMRSTYPNPHCLTVADAERLSRGSAT